MGQIPINKYIVWLFLSLPVLLQAQADSLVLEVSPKLNDGTLWRQETKIHPGRLMAGAAGILVADALGMLKLKETWYNDKRGKLHSVNWESDLRRWKQMDKIGHAVHCAFASDLFSKVYRWSGFSANSSIWMGSLTGWLWLLQIEITDGFFERWGFSWGDLIGNTVGSGFSALRQYYPDQFGGLRLKVSYHSSLAFQRKLYYRQEITFIDDYEGITFWLAANIYDMLPRAWQRGYPSFLKPFGLAIGQTVKGVAVNSLGGYREIMLSLDLDLTKIPLGPLDEIGIVRFIKDELNFLKMPMPTVRLSGDVVYYGFYF